MEREKGIDAANKPDHGRDEGRLRIQQNRHRNDSESDYHPTYSMNSLAEIPEMVPDGVVVASDNFNREEAMIKAPYQVTDEDEITLKSRITHLSFEKTLQIFEICGYDIRKTLSTAKKLVDPTLIPEQAQAMYVANIAVERQLHPSNMKKYKKFYLADTFKKVVDNKVLVDFYYNQKNKINTNFRQELESDEPMTEEEKIDLQQKMAASGIQLVGFSNEQNVENTIFKKKVPDSTHTRKTSATSSSKDLPDVPTGPPPAKRIRKNTGRRQQNNIGDVIPINTGNQNAPTTPIPLSASFKVIVREFGKRGDGENAYIVYKIETEVSSVDGLIVMKNEIWHRFSAFLELRGKVVEKYLYKGIAIPKLPRREVSVVTATEEGSDPTVNQEAASKVAKHLEKFIDKLMQIEGMTEIEVARDFLLGDDHNSIQRVSNRSIPLLSIRNGIAWNIDAQNTTERRIAWEPTTHRLSKQEQAAFLRIENVRNALERSNARHKIYINTENLHATSGAQNFPIKGVTFSQASLPKVEIHWFETNKDKAGSIETVELNGSKKAQKTTQ